MVSGDFMCPKGYDEVSITGIKKVTVIVFQKKNLLLNPLLQGNRF